VAGVPRERTALHVCRGNWTKDESAALTGSYEPLLPFLATAPVGTLFLELCTPRAGEIEVLGSLPDDLRIGVGVVNQKHERIETAAEVAARVQRAISVFGRDRVLLTPDCGFATFADNPVTSATIAEAKLRVVGTASGPPPGV
jgi:5-methyltetrahydropteroyltriglutamate--homocysteine methyltransferase